MRKQDNPKFSELLAVLSETYKPFSDAKQKIWAAVFKVYEIEDFEKAIFKHITDETKGTFEPKPADILRFMPEPKQLLIESKGSMEWCDNTQKLLNKYHPVTGTYQKQIGVNNGC